MRFLVDANTLVVEDTSGGKRLTLVFYATVYSADEKMLVNSRQR